MRAAGIDLELAREWKDDEVHVFHGDRADEHFAAHYHGANEAAAVLEADLERADVGHPLLRAVGQQHFALAEPL
ncbi:MAG TPA: hypothetical protein VFB93_18940 [Burkholderiales bacterium]|nr:hypothetical protein [Burkholderiales bacterium]